MFWIQLLTSAIQSLYLLDFVIREPEKTGRNFHFSCKNLTTNGFSDTERVTSPNNFSLKMTDYFQTKAGIYFILRGRTIEMVLMSSLIIHYNLAYSD